jgi:hypothetical protein
MFRARSMVLIAEIIRKTVGGSVAYLITGLVLELIDVSDKRQNELTNYFEIQNLD